jgi:hypothetical protein
LTVTNDLGFRTFGYADDIVIIVQGKFAHTVRELMQQALNVVVKWAGKEGLNISPHKTAIVPFTNKRILEGLGPLIINGKEFKMLDEVKYLGVILDPKLNWNQHLQKIIRKTQTNFAVVRRTCGRKWGLRLGMAHWLYTRVIRPSILYGALVWWPKVIQKHKNSTRQDSKNGLPSHHWGHENDPYSSYGVASVSDSVGSFDHGGGKAGTL